MTIPPDSRRLRRELRAALNSGWQPLDLVTALPEPGDEIRVTLTSRIDVVVTRDGDGDLRAYRCDPRPRGMTEIRCAVRYGMIFVNLDTADHVRVEDDVTALHPRRSA